ncbi:MAG: choice-of-anchor J domain-containing protein, partial [Cyclobacteriaceae bacterium]
MKKAYNLPICLVLLLCLLHFHNAFARINYSENNALLFSKHIKKSELAEVNAFQITQYDSQEDGIILQETFENCPLNNGWSVVTLSGRAWTCASGGGSMVANGRNATAPSDSWLIMPALNFSSTDPAKLSFDFRRNFSDIIFPSVEVFYSKNYSGNGNPNLATWH